ncbi:MAG: hypothetical protein MR868_01120 [Lachnospiraceae bacterium]|nr:hypothetical protein [Lachnospiraceae bacterium]
MKKYSICFYLFLAVSCVCMVIGYAAVRYERKDPARPASEAVRTEESTEGEQLAANQEQVIPKLGEQEQYCLMSENGFLLVYSKEREDVCLYTHMPLLDFPQEEQDRLREGIWFPSMIEVFQYLESFTS